ncbi:hypothetical protein CHUAL_011631 [Chamberlinius hualienensis]
MQRLNITGGDDAVVSRLQVNHVDENSNCARIWTSKLRRNYNWSKLKFRDFRMFLLLILFVSCTRVYGVSSLERPHYRTAYACEGSLLQISCDNGQLIHLIRANYGRFSITICNDHGNTDWSVNCIAARSFRVLQERCSQQTSCSIQASTSVFGEPCAGTLKYLEAHYQCLPASTTPSTTPIRFNTPWRPNINQQPPVITRPKSGTAENDEVVPGNGEVPVEIPAQSSTTTTTSSPINVVTSAVVITNNSHIGSGISSNASVQTIEKIVPVAISTQSPLTSTNRHQPTSPTPSTINVTLNNTTQLTASEPSIVITTTTAVPTKTRWELKADHCMPGRVRDLNWNWTRQGETAIINCPTGTTGFAKWRCSANAAKWSSDNPDLSDCKSVWLTDLANRIDQGDTVVNVAKELGQVTRSKLLYGGDVVETTAILKKMAHKMSEFIKVIPNTNKENVVNELMEAVVETGSNLLTAEQRHSWNDLNRQAQMKTATALLLGLEENSYLLADRINYEKVIVESDRNILMSVKVLRTQNIQELNFPDAEDVSNSVWDSAFGTLTLPVESLLDRATNGLVKVVFFTYNNLEELLQPDPVTEFSSQPYSNSKTVRMLNSKVISASFGRKHHMPLQQPVGITLKHLQSENVSNPTCVYWDYIRNTWSPSGCEVVATNQTHTVCECNHLTNFAVLMDVQGLQISPIHELALQTITYVGCIVSIVCLAVSFLTFTFFRGLKGDRNTIHKNLCICLLIAEVLFLAGISQTDKPILCSVIAGLLHFFFLCSFAWMFFEGFQLYVMLIEVFESEKSRVRWYYALAYGISALIVAVSCIVDPFSYGTDRYCWLRSDNYFIFSFVGPVIAVIVANVVFLSMAIFTMCRHLNVSAVMKKKEQSKLANVRTWIRGALALVFVLGLTWTFGLLYLNEESLVMAYVFTVLNSLQGLFIFVFHCLRNEKVQKEYRKLLRRSSCLASCLSEASKERRSSFYVNSNGTASVPNSSSTPVNSSLQSPPQQLQQQQLQQQQSYLKPHWDSGKTKNHPTSSVSGDLAKNSPIAGHPTVQDQEVENFSYKSSNRDSGHGGSEPEEILAAAGSLRFKRNNNNNNDNYGGITNDLSVMDCSVVDSDCSSSDYFREKLSVNNNDLQLQQQTPNTQPLANHKLNNQHYQHQPGVKSLRMNRQRHHGLHPHHLHNTLANPQHLHHQVRVSPFNHIYMDIESQHQREAEPVYEEIDRHEVQVSDYSDEDVATQQRSDISRQSSGSYGDNRPLISHLIAERNQIQGLMAAQGPLVAHRASLRPQNQLQQQQVLTDAEIFPEGPPYHIGQMPPHPQPIMPQMVGVENGVATGGSFTHHNPMHHRESTFHSPKSAPPSQLCDPNNENAMFVAMLDGRKVVSRLQPLQNQSLDRHHNHPSYSHQVAHQSPPPSQYRGDQHHSQLIHKLSHSEC